MCATESRQKNRKRILIVDDEPIVLESIRMLLSVDGHEIDTAPQGDAALEKFEPGKYDVVVTDYQMPGMNGHDLAKAIKRLAPTQPILMITAYAESVQRGRAMVEVDYVVHKPFTLAGLRQALQKVLPADTDSSSPHASKG